MRLWFQSLKMSGLTATILSLVLIAAVVLAPSFSTYLQQQREIAQLQESVDQRRASLDEIEQEQHKWQDPVYIRAQARERLFYVMPGEVQLTVIEDGVIIPEDEELSVSTELTPTERRWTAEFAASVLGAGTTTAEPEELLTTR
ncbi:septum formation initiator family protein [Leucobacter sp. UCMA 4100]|uniref:FtsB family cell division protein n=1 Tax=Leucobacter sp. UCMA 4100 TaxID=2810534 RepID=UPI0022EA94FA|nr:septum formation initiator family protein [Leucobacter sp. UCMA 4100]MDA3147836.1 septum formation initiator family protein [Leucobacter sp. UCMA 4100]